MAENQPPNIFRYILEPSKRTPSKEVENAWRRYFLGASSFKEVCDAKERSRKL
jgi:hypothetical protein